MSSPIFPVGMAASWMGLGRTKPAFLKPANQFKLAVQMMGKSMLV
jgi:hypothetical protein